MIFNISPDDANLPGIYIIKNNLDSRFYVGGSVSLISRYKTHLWALKKNKHGNAHLQYFFNKHGAESLEFSLLEVCSKECLTEREQYYLDTLQACINGFNHCPIARSTKGRRMSEETKAKIGLANKKTVMSEQHKKLLSSLNKGRKHTPEALAKISLAWKGKKRSPETIQKMKLAKTGVKYSDESRAKMSAAGKGRVISPEIRAKISATNKGKKKSPETIAKLKARVVSEETRAKRRAFATGRKFSDEAKAKMSKNCSMKRKETVLKRLDTIRIKALPSKQD